MSRKHLSALRFMTTWAGIVVTLSGILYNISQGGDIVGAYISLVGVCITAVGHIIGGAIQRHDEREREQNKEKIDMAESFIHEFGDIADDAQYLRTLIKNRKDEDFIRGFNGDDWK